MKLVTFLCIIAFTFSAQTQAQSVLGNWKTYKHETDKVRSIIKVFKKNDGKVYGRVIWIADKEDRDNLCVDCKGDDKNKKINGMILLKHYEKDGDEYVDGEITNPDNGKTYRSKLWLDEDNADILKVRGYIAFFYETKTWKRLKKGDQLMGKIKSSN